MPLDAARERKGRNRVQERGERQRDMRMERGARAKKKKERERTGCAAAHISGLESRFSGSPKIPC